MRILMACSVAFSVASIGWLGCAARPVRPASNPAVVSVPVEKDWPSTVRFAVVGDYGDNSAHEAAVAALVKSWDPAFVVTTGDNNYNFGLASSADDNIGRHYASFIGNYRGRYGPGSLDNRFWPSPGNHDWFNPAGLQPYLDYFTLPGNERYYDVAMGPVHLFLLDSDRMEPDGNTPDSIQAQWLRTRMEQSTACLKFVFFHHPPYSSATHGSSTNMRWPFREWGATAVFSGHDHTYERVETDGLLYFVDGLGGAETYDFKQPYAPGSQLRFNSGHGAMRVTVGTSNVEFEFVDVAGTVVDHVTRPHRCAGGAP